MAVYQVVKEGDSVLREKAKAVNGITPNILKLLDNMRDTMKATDGVGLAAPQIGISKKVVVIDACDEKLDLINPEIIMSEGAVKDTEACLSVPGLAGEVIRAQKVKVKALNRNGEEIELEREGFMARVMQHEIDHLEGILYIDKAENIRSVR